MGFVALLLQNDTFFEVAIGSLQLFIFVTEFKKFIVGNLQLTVDSRDIIDKPIKNVHFCYGILKFEDPQVFIFKIISPFFSITNLLNYFIFCL